MQRVMSATEARIHFGKLVQPVTESRESISVERGGTSHVVVLSVAEYERLPGWWASSRARRQSKPWPLRSSLLEESRLRLTGKRPLELEERDS